MWWMTCGGRENRAPQSPSGSLPLLISLPFSPALGQPPRPHTLSLECSGQWWIPNRPAAGPAHRLLSQQRERGHHGSSLSVFSPSDEPLCSTSPSPLSDSSLMLQEELSCSQCLSMVDTSCRGEACSAYVRSKRAILNLYLTVRNLGVSCFTYFALVPMGLSNSSWCAPARLTTEPLEL